MSNPMLTGDYVHDVELLSAQVRTLEAELTRRAGAAADEREKYQRDRQIWADKKKAWVAHDARLKQRAETLRRLLEEAPHCPTPESLESLDRWHVRVSRALTELAPPPSWSAERIVDTGDGPHVTQIGSEPMPEPKP